VRDHRRLPNPVLAALIPVPPTTTARNPALLIAPPPTVTMLAPPLAASLLNGLDARPRALFVGSDSRQRDAAAGAADGAPGRAGRGLERRVGSVAARAVVGRDLLAQEDAQHGQRGADDGDRGFDRGPDDDVFAVVGEIGFSDLLDVDALDDGAEARSVGC
jgi:hypothetical protein